jgi:hypothetical protein
MKRSIKMLAGVIALSLAGFVATASTGTSSTNANSVRTLTDTEWQEIAEDAEFEQGIILEAIPAIRTVNVKSLEMDFKPGKQTHLLLNAPFGNQEEIGVVVLDQNGEVVFSTSGLYEDVRNLRFPDYYTKDMTYVVRLYSSSTVFETKLQVVHL